MKGLIRLKITEPFIFTGLQSQTLDVEVYILDEKNDRDLYVKTVQVQTEVATFKLRTDNKELKKIFDKVIHQLNQQDNVKMISRIINAIELEMIGEFEQIIKGRHEVFTLKIKIK